MKKYKLAILKNETDIDHLPWVESCQQKSERVDYDVIDIIENNWLEKIIGGNFDCILTRPPGRIAYFKQLYDERVYIINKVLEIPIYPSLNEVLIYENKRMLAQYLSARNIPHPKTFIFYDKKEALAFEKSCNYPIVAKTNIGAGGSGVKILKTSDDLKDYINRAFSERGISRTYLPNIRKGDYLKRISKRLMNLRGTIGHFHEKYKSATVDTQKWFVLFQEYIKCDFEWRCVVVGDSYFGHKKLRTIGELMSGTSAVSWDYPDEKLLDFIHKIMTTNGFKSQAIDIFYNESKGYLVNELQCFWGSKNPHQMIIDGVPGRFFKDNSVWKFEEGTFNQNNSYDLRLEHVLEILENKGKIK